MRGVDDVSDQKLAGINIGQLYRYSDPRPGFSIGTNRPTEKERLGISDPILADSHTDEQIWVDEVSLDGGRHVTQQDITGQQDMDV